MTFKIYTLGCKVNSYESNVIRNNLLENGYQETKNKADIYVINTCTVTNASDTKSHHIIRRCKRLNNAAIIVVCGCMTQQNSDVKEASIILGNKYKNNISELIEEYKQSGKKIVLVEDITTAEFEEMKITHSDKTRAFVKIEDGCNNYCAYCIIPYVRGRVRSKKPEHVLSEIKDLVQKGHKEIILTGIHTGQYGIDLDNYSFTDLLKEIINIPSLERLRISSIEITEINETFLSIIKNNKKIVDHLHIPLQSGSDDILLSMNRKYNIKFFKEQVKKIRTIRPNISLTTDIIVGFPGETEDYYQETIQAINSISFSKIHVFPFSLKKGTKAELLSNQNDNKTTTNRVNELLELSKKLETYYMEKFLNKDVSIIPEKYKDGFLIGHTGNYILVKAKSDEYLSDTVTVTIKSIEYPYCVGEIKRES